MYNSVTGEYKTLNVQSVYKDMYAQMRALIAMIEDDAPENPDIDAVMSAFNIALTAVRAIREKKTLEVKNTFQIEKKFVRFTGGRNISDAERYNPA